MDVGVSDIAIYSPPLYISHKELATVRGVPWEKYQIGLGNYNMSIIPNWEDAVTMAANAAIQVLDKTFRMPTRRPSRPRDWQRREWKLETMLSGT